MRDLACVVRPGGYLLLTFNGTVGREALESNDRDRFDGGELVVHGAAFQGRNFCAVYHPAMYVPDVLANGLQFRAEVPAVDPPFDHGQDGYLLRVPAAG
jgi:hypothetical protein